MNLVGLEKVAGSNYWRNTLAVNKYTKIGIGVVIGIAAILTYHFYGTASLQITSEPTGALVRVDGLVRGRTPIARVEVDAGRHRIEIEHSYFKPHVETVSMDRGDHLQHHFELELGEGTFEFLSNPKGAWVEIDGERIDGRTPIVVKSTSGPHQIAMGDLERRSTQELHELAHGETKEVNFDLNLDPHGSLVLRLNPSDAVVEFLPITDEDGTAILYEPNIRIPIGEHPMRVSRPGFVTQEFRHKVVFGENIHSVTLQRSLGELMVTASPDDAQVEVSYTDAGKEYTKEYARRMQVPVGDVRIRARAMGYRTDSKSVRIGTKGATVRFDLQPITISVGAELSDELRSGGQAPMLVVVPAGSFLMGDSDGPPSEVPAHEVTITQPFAVSRFEVTVAQYLLFADTTRRDVSDKFDRTRSDHPMTRVSHEDAVAYTQWLSLQTGRSYRLLSESEWEYVARAGGQGHYFFGNDPQELCKYANVADRTAKKAQQAWQVVECDDSHIRTSPVGSFAPNPFGLYDIYGNVSEWVADCSVPQYMNAPSDGSAVTRGISCTTHGHRGASWGSSADEARSAYRNAASLGNDTRGIRIARDL